MRKGGGRQRFQRDWARRGSAVEFPWYAKPGVFLIVSAVRRHIISTVCIATAAGVAAAFAGSAVVGGPYAGWQHVQRLFGAPGPPQIVSAVALGSGYPLGTILLEVRNGRGGPATIHGYELVDAHGARPAAAGAHAGEKMCAMGLGKHALGAPIRVDRRSGAHVVLRSWRGADECGFGIRLLTDHGVTAPVMLFAPDPADDRASRAMTMRMEAPTDRAARTGSRASSSPYGRLAAGEGLMNEHAGDDQWK